MRRLLGPAVTCAAVAALLVGGAQHAAATPTQVFAVTTTADTVDLNTGDGICADSGGQCSLRAAVEEANADGGTNEIDLPAGTYSLTQGQLQLSVTVALLGAGARTTTIKQTGASTACSRSTAEPSPSPVSRSQAASESSGSGDLHPGVGGGIYVAGGASLSLTRATVSGNTATCRAAASTPTGRSPSTTARSAATTRSARATASAVASTISARP